MFQFRYSLPRFLILCHAENLRVPPKTPGQAVARVYRERKHRRTRTYLLVELGILLGAFLAGAYAILYLPHVKLAWILEEVWALLFWVWAICFVVGVFVWIVVFARPGLLRRSCRVAFSVSSTSFSIAVPALLVEFIPFSSFSGQAVLFLGVLLGILLLAIYMNWEWHNALRATVA